MNHTPLVSILMPNLNNRNYLEERMQSIINQSVTDWELIILDSHSTDGAWEYLENWSRLDSRIMARQSDLTGIYNNLNLLIRMARGNYIYIATSDDSMTPEALETMSHYLEHYPECDLAHCKLSIIDETGRPSKQKRWDDFFMIRYFGSMIDIPHIRKAPHDGLLHLSGITVYTSLTQIMIRRSLFARIGLFPEDIGSIADYEWMMRATLLADTIHIPAYLACWRQHPNQATSDRHLERAKASGKFISMARHALQTAEKINPSLHSLRLTRYFFVLETERLHYQMEQTISIGNKWRFIACHLLIHPYIFLQYYYRKYHRQGNALCQQDFLEYIKKVTLKLKMDQNLIPLEKPLKR
ncbi:MAG: glycosyltransferase [Candidatus Delongbacteria bacterium]|nr:glycosyltransferase [Candidatus Delongbacteria bacterium]